MPYRASQVSQPLPNVKIIYCSVGLQNHPYLYSQYPIDFPSASSHAYSVSGVSPQFASPEMYSPTAMGAQVQSNEIMHQSDVTAQQSQQAPTLLVNSTRAAERWDGKSKLLKYFEPIIDGVRDILDPIANVLYGAIPATVRGLNSKVSTTKSVDADFDADELELVKKPRHVLVPQPRNIAQRKINLRKFRHRPKKYAELKINLTRLKNNKDLYEYIKTKKYKYNYPNTYFYPRVKHFVNPNNFIRPSSSTRLTPYIKEASNIITTTVTPIITTDTEWKPIVSFNNTFPKITMKKRKRNLRKRQNKKRHHRPKRSTDVNINYSNENARFFQKSYSNSRFFVGFLDILLKDNPINDFFGQSTKSTNSKVESILNSKAPGYYSIAYNILMMSIDVIEGLFEINEAIKDHYTSGSKRNKEKVKKKEKSDITINSNCTQVHNKFNRRNRG